MGAMVRHWDGMILARWRSFSSSSSVHSVFFTLGSSHSYLKIRRRFSTHTRRNCSCSKEQCWTANCVAQTRQCSASRSLCLGSSEIQLSELTGGPYHLALHCLADFLTRREATRLQLLSPYFITAAFRISSSLFLHTPPLINIRTIFPKTPKCQSPGDRLSLHPTSDKFEGTLKSRTAVRLPPDYGSGWLAASRRLHASCTLICMQDRVPFVAAYSLRESGCGAVREGIAYELEV